LAFFNACRRKKKKQYIRIQNYETATRRLAYLKHLSTEDDHPFGFLKSALKIEYSYRMYLPAVRGSTIQLLAAIEDVPNLNCVNPEYE
jgi:hypothetical protein